MDPGGTNPAIPDLKMPVSLVELSTDEAEAMPTLIQHR
jgi:hypothetical protein